MSNEKLFCSEPRNHHHPIPPHRNSRPRSTKLRRPLRCLCRVCRSLHSRARPQPDRLSHQVGINPRTWYSVGFDYSVSTGSEQLTTALLPGFVASPGKRRTGSPHRRADCCPRTTTLAVNTDATTQTFALGPQLIYRHFSRVAIFVRPSLGALRERAVPHPGDPFATIVANRARARRIQARLDRFLRRRRRR